MLSPRSARIVTTIWAAVVSRTPLPSTLGHRKRAMTHDRASRKVKIIFPASPVRLTLYVYGRRGSSTGQVSRIAPGVPLRHVGLLLSAPMGTASTPGDAAVSRQSAGHGSGRRGQAARSVRALLQEH